MWNLQGFWNALSPPSVGRLAGTESGYRKYNRVSWPMNDFSFNSGAQRNEDHYGSQSFSKSSLAVRVEVS
jgi:hypothetical protein